MPCTSRRAEGTQQAWSRHWRSGSGDCTSGPIRANDFIRYRERLIYTVDLCKWLKTCCEGVESWESGTNVRVGLITSAFSTIKTSISISGNYFLTNSSNRVIWDFCWTQCKSTSNYQKNPAWCKERRRGYFLSSPDSWSPSMTVVSGDYTVWHAP